MLDGPHEEFAAGLRRLLSEGERITVVSLTRSFRRGDRLMAGFEHASGQTIVTLPAYQQIDARDFEAGRRACTECDVAVGAALAARGRRCSSGCGAARSTACSAG